MKSTKCAYLMVCVLLALTAVTTLEHSHAKDDSVNMHSDMLLQMKDVLHSLVPPPAAADPVAVAKPFGRVKEATFFEKCVDWVVAIPASVWPVVYKAGNVVVHHAGATLEKVGQSSAWGHMTRVASRYWQTACKYMGIVLEQAQKKPELVFAFVASASAATLWSWAAQAPASPPASSSGIMRMHEVIKNHASETMLADEDAAKAQGAVARLQKEADETTEKLEPAGEGKAAAQQAEADLEKAKADLEKAKAIVVAQQAAAQKAKDNVTQTLEAMLQAPLQGWFFNGIVEWIWKYVEWIWEYGVILAVFIFLSLLVFKKVVLLSTEGCGDVVFALAKTCFITILKVVFVLGKLFCIGLWHVVCAFVSRSLKAAEEQAERFEDLERTSKVGESEQAEQAAAVQPAAAMGAAMALAPAAAATKRRQNSSFVNAILKRHGK